MQKIEKSNLESKIINIYKKGDLSLGQFSKKLNINSYEEAMKRLSNKGIDVIDYDFKDDMKFIDSFSNRPF